MEKWGRLGRVRPLGGSLCCIPNLVALELSSLSLEMSHSSEFVWVAAQNCPLRQEGECGEGAVGTFSCPPTAEGME